MLQDKKILITGGNGFVGHNLVRYLTMTLDCCHLNVITPARHVLDCTDMRAVQKYMDFYKPDIVIHLAGKVGGVKANKESMSDFYFENIMMGTVVLEASRRAGVEKFIGLGAGCGYPNTLHPPYAENDLFNGFPEMSSYGYSMAKKGLIIHAMAAKEQYSFNSTILLPANLYGPYDNFDLHKSHVIPALVRKFVETGEDGVIDVWGSPLTTREFLFSKDMVKAIVDSINIDDVGPFNVGTGVETPIGEVIDHLVDITDFKGTINWDHSQPKGQKCRFYNMDKFKDVFGYIPNTSIRKGLEETTEWYQTNQSGARN